MPAIRCRTMARTSNLAKAPELLEQCPDCRVVKMKTPDGKVVHQHSIAVFQTITQARCFGCKQKQQHA